ncbi:MAG: protein-glutamine gamma-glutamyltransferase [Actinomycetota bacterium]|jgi:transglutaminase-like putative cysteine protease|nr:protein-glutamine gamma-glutamyltransferase [Actinomycetota bacterium]
MVKKANAKHPPEESVALRASVLVAVLASTLAVLAQGVGGGALRLASTVGIAGGFAYSHWARYRSGYALKAMLAVGVLLAFAGFLRVATGIQPGAINEVQLPLAELFLWVQFFHSLDVPARRDLLFSLLSSLVLMAVAGVLSVSSALGLNLLVWGAATVVSLVLAHRSEVAALPSLGRLAGESRATVEARRSWGLRSATPALGVLALVGLVGGAIFLVVPAAGAGKAVAFPAKLPSTLAVPRTGGLANPSLGADDPAGDGRRSSTGTGAMASGYFGFTDHLDTAARGRPDNTLVMRVKAARPDFWRGQSFDTWDGRVWKQSHVRPVVASASDGSAIDLQGAAEDRDLGALDLGHDFVQTVYVEQPGPNLVFSAYAPAKVYFNGRSLFELDDGTVRTGVQLPEGSVYTVVSRRPPVTEETLRYSGLSGAALPAATQARYLQLPADVPARVRDLAASVTADAPTAYDKVLALEGWMAANTAYSLDAPRLPAGADAVDQFLFVDRVGFCEQIGSSLVVMLRSLGVPARLAVGYTPGERNPFTGLFEVRARDAHAWAEVWFPGVGWQAFDPTASVPLAGDPYSSAAGAGIVSFLRARLPSLPSWLPRTIGLVALAGAPLVGLSMLAAGRLRRRRALARRSWAEVQLDRLERAGAAHGRSRRPWEGPRRYADILARSVLPDPRLRAVADALESDAWSGDPPSEAARLEAEALLAAVLTADSRRDRRESAVKT